MAKKKLIYLLIFEVIAGVNAAVVFNIFSRPVAGFVAGAAFAAIGLAAIWSFIHHTQRFRKTSLAVAGVYFFGFAMPLWAARLFTPMDRNVNIVLGLPIEVFHRGSEIMFMILVAVTLLQIYFNHDQSRRL